MGIKLADSDYSEEELSLQVIREVRRFYDSVCFVCHGQFRSRGQPGRMCWRCEAKSPSERLKTARARVLNAAAKIEAKKLAEDREAAFNVNCLRCGDGFRKWKLNAMSYCFKPECKKEAIRLNKNRRRNQPRGERVTLSYIAERDGCRCGLCGDDVKMSLKWPHPKSPSIDHIVPISMGGEHSLRNTRLAHLRCNIVRHNKPDGSQLVMFG